MFAMAAPSSVEQAAATDANMMLRLKMKVLKLECCGKTVANNVMFWLENIILRSCTRA